MVVGDDARELVQSLLAQRALPVAPALEPAHAKQVTEILVEDVVDPRPRYARAPGDLGRAEPAHEQVIQCVESQTQPAATTVELPPLRQVGFDL